jgi:hypothetical protein
LTASLPPSISERPSHLFHLAETHHDTYPVFSHPILFYCSHNTNHVLRTYVFCLLTACQLRGSWTFTGLNHCCNPSTQNTAPGTKQMP